MKLTELALFYASGDTARAGLREPGANYTFLLRLRIAPYKGTAIRKLVVVSALESAPFRPDATLRVYLMRDVHTVMYARVLRY